MTASTAAEILRVEDVWKRFGSVEALRGASLTLNAGEVLAVVGDNGAGKSTLIKNISGVYQPDRGSIFLEGSRVTMSSPRHARALGIETVYQDLALAGDLSVGANIFLGREPVRRFLGVLPFIDNRKIREETESLLHRIESHIPKAAVSVENLSGGQRQAIAIARALYWKAKVVILDEPTAALAAMERENVIRLARRLAAEGVGVIYIGHNLLEILEVADRIAVMYRGQVVHTTQSKETTQTEIIKHMTGLSELSAA
jgi:ABC-type sugar transport system ATPase subunit